MRNISLLLLEMFSFLVTLTNISKGTNILISITILLYLVPFLFCDLTELCLGTSKYIKILERTAIVTFIKLLSIGSTNMNL